MEDEGPLASTLDLSRNQKILATAGVAMSLLLASLDQTVVGNSMPRIVAELQGLNYYAWVTTAYLLTSTIILPIAGKLGDMFGRKPFMLAGMIGFVAASALCGVSQNMAELVIFRGIQGLFGGMLFASVFAVLADIFPPEQRARMQGVFGGVFGLSAVIGPTIGGWLTDGPGWRWVFYVNVPVGIAAVLLVSAALPYVRSRAHLRDIDWVGCILLAAGLVPMLIAFSLTSNHKWSDPEVTGLLAIAAVVLVAFFFWERRAGEPIVPFSLFRNNVFAVSVVIAFFSALGMFGTILFVPLLYQGVLAVSASNSGELLTPMFVGLIGFSTLAVPMKR
jgi:EmrB/QacA subfamily drug resistance transporter